MVSSLLSNVTEDIMMAVTAKPTLKFGIFRSFVIVHWCSFCLTRLQKNLLTLILDNIIYMTYFVQPPNLPTMNGLIMICYEPFVNTFNVSGRIPPRHIIANTLLKLTLNTNQSTGRRFHMS